MPSKSRRNKGKHLAQSKKRSVAPNFRPVVEIATTPTLEPAAASPVLRPAVAVPNPVAKAAAAKYVYVATELRTIGILAATMLIILIVLSKVLS